MHIEQTFGVDTFQPARIEESAVQALNDVNKFQANKATIGASAVATVTAANSAVTGNYSLEVTQLAQAQKLVALGQTSTSSAIGAGTSGVASRCTWSGISMPS